MTQSKQYREENVYEAGQDRLRFAFNEFDNIYLSVSGGKDSSVLMQLATEIAEEENTEFSILFVDLEAQYQATIDQMETLIENSWHVLDDIYWVCLPLSLRNAVSQIQPKWTCWNREKRDKWVRDLPSHDYVLSEDDNPFDFFEYGMEFEDFIDLFAQWFNQKKGGTSGAGIAIRSNESLNRFRTLINQDKSRYKDRSWTTQVKLGDQPIPVYNFYPIYDWTVEDVWGYVARFDKPYNQVYEQMYKNGVPLSDQRICQPYGDDQRNGLDQFRALEPVTWEKVLNRVSGVNFGNIYARTSLLGNIESEKPSHLSWEEYAVFLLESVGLYCPELRDHYVGKIQTFLEWYEDVEYEETGWTEEMGVEDIPDSHPEDMPKNKYPSWERIAWAIERNDFWMKRLGFSQTKGGREKLQELRSQYGDSLVQKRETDDKHLKEWVDSE